MHALSQVWPLIWILALFHYHHANAVIVPVRLRPAGSGLQRRDLHAQAELLRPRHEIQLTYAEETGQGRPYVIQVAARHDTRPYVLLEEMDDLLTSVDCSVDVVSPSVSIMVSFKHGHHLALAQEHWNHPEGLTFVTNRPLCNEPLQHAAYRSSVITFDPTTVTAQVKCELVEFGPGSDASTSLNFTGGTATSDLAERIDSPRRPRFRRRQAHQSSQVFPFNEVWSGKQQWYNAPGLEVNCVGCRAAGELTAAFDIALADLNPSKVVGSLTAGIMSPQLLRGLTKKMELSVEASRPMKAVMNYEVKAQTAISFGFPGLMFGKDRLNLEDKPQIDYNRVLFQFGPWTLKASFKFGRGLGVNLAGAVDFTYPVLATIPINQRSTVSLVDPDTAKSNIRPTIKAGPAKVDKIDASMCFTAGFGPSIELVLEIQVPGKPTVALAVAAAIDAPKVQTCLSVASGVDKACNPGGPLKNAVREKTTLAVGLAGGARLNAAAAPDAGAAAIPAFALPFPAALHPTWTLDERCLPLALLPPPRLRSPPPPRRSGRVDSNTDLTFGTKPMTTMGRSFEGGIPSVV